MLVIQNQPQPFKQLIEEYNSSFDANFMFLNSTLLSSLKVSSRNSVSFFSPRRWRKDLKSLQVVALKNLKLQAPEDGVQVIARQIVSLSQTIANGNPYEFVTHVPGGSSGRAWNFAALIAYSVAKELGVPHQPAFIGSTSSIARSSHPSKARYFRPGYCEGVITGSFGLLVDDVATTGTHFEKCLEVLRKHDKSVVCISWIS